MKTISLPRSPFFCVREGRYLPTLTGLIIEAATLQQRTEIEEELFKLRLKRKCFVALAERAPDSICGPIATATGMELSRHVANVGGLTDRAEPQLPNDFPASDSDSADRRSPGSRAPFDDFGAPRPGVHVVSPAETRSPVSDFNPMNAYPKGRYNP